MKKTKWSPREIQIKTKAVNDDRFQQLLAEVREVLYKRLCLLSSETSSAEPPNQELGPIQKEVS